MRWWHGFGCDKDGFPIGDEGCTECCRHGVTAIGPACQLCAESVQLGDVLLLVGDHFYTHVVSDPAMWQAPEMDSTCQAWMRGRRVIWARLCSEDSDVAHRD